MTTPLILIVTAIYLGVAASEAVASRYGMALTFAAYALANVGLVWHLWRAV